MPTYEYACNRCGIIEVFQSIREDALTACPQCTSKKIERLISGGAGVIFKGDGFWETDYNRSSDYQKQSQTESADKSKASGADAAASETSTVPKAQPGPSPEPESET